MALANAGADVVLVGPQRRQASSTPPQLVAATGRRAVVAPADVTDADSITTALAGAGPIDLLVNNAGGARFAAELAGVRRSGWDKTVALNLTGPLLVAQACLPAMVAAGRGRDRQRSRRWPASRRWSH